MSSFCPTLQGHRDPGMLACPRSELTVDLGRGLASPEPTPLGLPHQPSPMKWGGLGKLPKLPAPVSTLQDEISGQGACCIRGTHQNVSSVSLWGREGLLNPMAVEGLE